MQSTSTDGGEKIPLSGYGSLQPQWGSQPLTRATNAVETAIITESMIAPSSLLGHIIVTKETHLWSCEDLCYVRHLSLFGKEQGFSVSWAFWFVLQKMLLMALRFSQVKLWLQTLKEQTPGNLSVSQFVKFVDSVRSGSSIGFSRRLHVLIPRCMNRQARIRSAYLLLMWSVSSHFSQESLKIISELLRKVILICTDKGMHIAHGKSLIVCKTRMSLVCSPQLQREERLIFSNLPEQSYRQEY